jgi:hypothetical protein
VALVAEKVETQEEFKQARAEGFALFQGYYFCRPVLMENRKVPHNRLSQIEILQLLRDESIELRKLTQLIKRDAALTYRLLRVVNSPLCAIRQEVNSIQSALLAVGEEAFRRILTLAITSELCSDQPAELLRMAFVRGRFCELAAALCALDPTEQYLLGMLSLLPAMLRLPMEELTPALPLRNEIRSALEGAANPERCLLQWLECHEHADWAGCDAVVLANGLQRGAGRSLLCRSSGVGRGGASLCRLNPNRCPGPTYGCPTLAAFSAVAARVGCELLGLGRRRGVAGDGRRRAGRAHGVDRGCQEGSILDGALDADGVAHLDVGQGDGLAALAEGGVLVGHKDVGCCRPRPSW